MSNVSPHSTLTPETEEQPVNRRMARNTAIFSIATGVSRITGLGREMVQASYYGTGGPASAFGFAFQIPNLVRSLFADAALSAAFVPIFTDLLEKNRKKDAYELASALFTLIVLVLGLISLVCILLAPLLPLFTGPEFDKYLDSLVVGLAQVLFPIVVLLGLNGLVIGILNVHDHFTMPAIAPIVCNIMIVGVLVGVYPLLSGPNKIYALAIGVVVGTLVQLLISLPALRRVGFRLRFSLKFRNNPHVKSVLVLMIPVTVSLGIINFDLFLNIQIGTWISEQASASIEKAFRIYMLPQGMFSVAVATVLFPAFSRFASNRDLSGLRAINGNGIRLICLFLIPAAAATIVLAEPFVRLIYERGEFDDLSTVQTTEALFWFSFSLPFAGVNLLLSRSFFALQLPWFPTALAGASLAVNAVISILLYKPLGIAGTVIGTAVASAAMTVGQVYFLRKRLGGLELKRTLTTSVLITLASLVMAAAMYGVWFYLDDITGSNFIGQLLSVMPAIAVGGLMYLAIVHKMNIFEARQITEMVTRRFRRA